MWMQLYEGVYDRWDTDGRRKSRTQCTRWKVERAMG